MAATNKIVVLITGEPAPSIRERRGDFRRIIGEAAGAGPELLVGVDARTEQDLAGATHGASAVIITGSSAHVQEREAWVLRAESWLRAVVPTRLPVLGICFGHQLLGQALGGQVTQNPAGREIGTVTIERTAEDSLLAGLERFTANACHSDTVHRLPPDARVLARSSRDPHQCVRFAERCYGVQFHPEFDGDIMRGFIVERAAAVRAEGGDPDAIHEQARDTPESAALLAKFLRLGWRD